MNHSAIYRYPLDVTYYQELIQIPTAHKILSVAPGRDQPRDYEIDLWMKVSPSDVHTRVAIYMLSTGHPVPVNSVGADLDLKFIGTCVMNDGLVWHVFEGPVKK